MNKIFKWIFEIPWRTSPKGMKWSYNFTAPYFWWREMWHLIGGLSVAFFGGAIPYWCGAGIWGFVVSGALLSSAIMYQEISDREKGQSWFKTFIDFFFWMVVGFLNLAIWVIR